jgi:hypothetical protein
MTEIERDAASISAEGFADASLGPGRKAGRKPQAARCRRMPATHQKFAVAPNGAANENAPDGKSEARLDSNLGSAVQALQRMTQIALGFKHLVRPQNLRAESDHPNRSRAVL